MSYGRPTPLRRRRSAHRATSNSRQLHPLPPTAAEQPPEGFFVSPVSGVIGPVGSNGSGSEPPPEPSPEPGSSPESESVDVQVSPSPVNPPGHAHWREPGWLVQTARGSQPPLLVAHSLMSTHI